MTLPSKKVLLIVVVIVAIPVVAFAWWLVSPLFFSKTVVEEFPMSASAQIPENMTQDEAEKAMEVIAKIDMPAMEEMPEMPPEMNDEPVAVASGQFRDGDSFHKGSGAVTLYRLPTGEGLVRFEGLNVTNGPDLRVLVTAHPDPMTRADVHDADYTEIGKLKGNKGDQNYDVPADLDLASIRSIVIYCAPFQVVFSVAPLQHQAG